MQAKKRYLLVSVVAGLLFLIYLWGLQIGEFQQQPYHYPQIHQYHQQDYQYYYYQRKDVYQPQPLPQRLPSRPARRWPELTELLDPYLEGGEQEVGERGEVWPLFWKTKTKTRQIKNNLLNISCIFITNVNILLNKNPQNETIKIQDRNCAASVKKSAIKIICE